MERYLCCRLESKGRNKVLGCSWWNRWVQDGIRLLYQHTNPIPYHLVLFNLGDIALRILNHAKDKYADRKIHVQMLDINPDMLEEGKKRFARTMYHDGGLQSSRSRTLQQKAKES